MRQKLLLILIFLLLLTLIENVTFSVGINLSVADILIFLLLVLVCFEIKKVTLPYDDLGNGTGVPFLIKLRFVSRYENPVSAVSQKYIIIFLILLAYYLLIIVYSTLNGSNIHRIMGRFRNLFVYPLSFFVGLLSFKARDDIKTFIFIFHIFFLISVIIGTIHLFNPISFLSKDSADFYAKVVNQRVGLMSVFIFIYALLNYSFSINKIISLLLLALCTYSAIFSQNRSILVCYIVSILLYIFWTIFKKRLFYRTLTLITVTSAICILAFTQLVNSSYWDQYKVRYTKIKNEITGERDFGQLDLRIARSIAALKRWTDSPIIGPGFGGQLIESDIYDSKGNYLRTAYGTSHNYYVTILEQTGLIGFIIILCIYFNIFQDIKPTMPLSKDRIIDYSLYGFFLVSLLFNLANVYLYGLVSYIAASYFFWGMAVSVNKMKDGMREV